MHNKFCQQDCPFPPCTSATFTMDVGHGQSVASESAILLHGIPVKTSTKLPVQVFAGQDHLTAVTISLK